MGNEIIKNILLILFLSLFLVIFLYLYLKNKTAPAKSFEDDPFDIRTMVKAVKKYFNEIISEKIDIMSGEAEKRREDERRELGKAVRNCGNGSINAKIYLQGRIKEWLTGTWIPNPKDLDRVISFNEPSELSAPEKFEILLYDFERDHRYKAAGKLIEELLELKENGPGNVISSEEVDRLYELRKPYLDKDSKADIITRFIYRQYKGHGVIDSLRDQEIDGISAGVSGVVDNGDLKPANIREAGGEGLKNYESVWVFNKGNMVRLSFLSFGSQAELERVCKNIYRYNSPGQLSASKGFIANDMQDGSRVIVVRPPFAESWAFFIRKFGKKGTMPVGRIVRGEGSRDIIRLLKYIISGCQVFGITGEQGCGKTTLLKALIEYIPPEFTLRIQELLFELHLREEYPERNIVTFRETETIPGRDALDLQKKTDGMVNIIGEVVSAPVAGWLVMVSQVASRFTIFTHHAKTTENLVTSLRNDLMSASGFNDEETAERQVRQAVRFDVHMVRLQNGERRIQKITEIARTAGLPEGNRVIAEMTPQGYRMVNPVSEETETEMLLQMDEEDAKAFIRDQNRWKRGGVDEEGYIA